MKPAHPDKMGDISDIVYKKQCQQLPISILETCKRSWIAQEVIEEKHRLMKNQKLRANRERSIREKMDLTMIDLEFIKIK